MINNPMNAITSFIQSAQQRYGNNFDPSVTARNMLGQNCNTPKEALDLMLRTGRINQSQYDMFLRML